VRPIRFVAYSDYLCPWCFNASRRLYRLEDEEPDVEVTWKSYLLRPRPAPHRDLEKFRRYTESWRRPAAEPDAGDFRVWSTDAGPPSHSVPAHLVAKAAAELGREAFRSVHERLLVAYFEDNRDISDTETLRTLWGEAGLPAAEFGRREDPAILEQVLAEHAEALEMGANGVPAIRQEGRDAAVTGALPYESYTRWVRKVRARAAEAADPDSAPGGNL
jgi:predicted DsbA family dithiol-disulfide isomerase